VAKSTETAVDIETEETMKTEIMKNDVNTNEKKYLAKFRCLLTISVRAIDWDRILT
jgi:hypothetical protein